MKHFPPPFGATKATIATLVWFGLAHHPRTASELARMLGMTKDQVRNGIDAIRAHGVAVWSSRYGFWADGRPAPTIPSGVGRGSMKWKEEPTSRF